MGEDRALDYKIAEFMCQRVEVPEWGTMAWKGHDGFCDNVLMDRPPYYSSDMQMAWLVFRHCMDNFIYSKRERFFEALQEQATTPSKNLVAWPHVLAYLKDRFPEVICVAALKVLES